jgi:hypothetical protein
MQIFAAIHLNHERGHGEAVEMPTNRTIPPARQHCGALHWFAEETVKSSKTISEFSQCCKHGEVQLADL